MISCVLIIACLVVGFMLGRLGSNVYDGLLFLGSKPENHRIELSIDDEDLPCCPFVILKVVDEEKEKQM